MMNLDGKDYKYKFSVVIPVYNVENFLRETVDSVIAQTIGFKESIQIIFVNDGSPDNSEEICLEYKEKYPNNVVYIKQENAGVSAARNTGIKYIEGKYVNFLDSDDCWTEDSFEKVYAFFEQEYDKLDVVTARKKFFDAREGYHRLDYRFKEGTRTVNLKTEYECIQMDVTGAFVKAAAIGQRKFYTNLKYGEDAQFVNSILLDKCILGVIYEAEHLYRKRPDESSALQNEVRSKSYYFNSLVDFHQDMFRQSMEKYGKILDFIQYMVMYDIQWRLRKPVFELLDREDYEKYRQTIIDELQNIEDRIILNQKSMFMDMKAYALNLKHGVNICDSLVYDHGRLLYNNSSMLNINDAKSIIILHFIDIIDNVLYLEGKDNCWLKREDYSYCIEVEGERFYPEFYDVKMFDTVAMDGIIYNGRGFKLAIPLDDGEKRITFSMRYKDIEEKAIYVGSGKFAHLPPISRQWGYYCKDNYILRFNDKSLEVIKNTTKKHRRFEKNYRRFLCRSGKRYLLKYRILYSILHKFYKDKIWLISDRVNKANDNGEHLFRYVCSLKSKKIKPYYVIDKTSEDYNKMKKIGKVIPYNTPLYRLFFLLSNKIISSSGNEYVINAFDNDKRFLSDLYNFDYVFLQHGVTKDDLSGWVNKYNKNIKALVTAGKPEYTSFCEGDYYYTPDIPILSGFPRHDNLMRMQKETAKNEDKQILIIPTWRKSIKGSYNPVTGESIYYKNFKDTDYFKFYNSLINDSRLCRCMKEYGYKGLFCMHPSHTKQSVDFTENDVFKINRGYVDYQQEFAKNALMVTDYSSVFFDFAYLKKPIVYSQFDKEEFFAGEHAYKKGYFSYEDNGFGPVCYDLESTVNAIISYIKNDCKNSDKYVKRIEDFYPYFDENSCKRVYEYICKIPY